MIAAVEIVIALDEDRVVPADRGEEALIVTPDPWPHFAVIEAGRYLDLESHSAPRHLQDPQELLAWLEPSAPAHREAVDETRLTGAGAERGLENQRVLHVPA